jgi:hypothetical protein
LNFGIMSDTDFDRLKRIFADAIDLDGEERTEFLDGACGGDAMPSCLKIQARRNSMAAKEKAAACRHWTLCLTPTWPLVAAMGLPGN